MTSPPERPEGADPRQDPDEGPSGAAGTGGGRDTAGARGPADGPVPADGDAEGRGPLRRSSRQKGVAGVCGGLGRYCDVDPVIFRIVIGVLSVTGGLGMIFYGFAWLLIPVEGEDENEGRRMLSGRVDGAALVAVLLALIGCGLFLSMLGNGGTLSFAVMLSIAVVGSAVWSQRRRATAPGGLPFDPVATEAPPETRAPPVPGSPSWWRDPIVKDGNTGPVGSPYLWGPADAYPTARAGRGDDRPVRGDAPPPSAAEPRPVRIGGMVFVLALVAGGLGTGLSWHTEPLGTSLELGLAAALGVLGLGLVVSAFVGRTGFGTVFLTLLTAALLAGAAALPKDIGTQWHERTWVPATATSVHGGYRLGSGVGTLDLRAVDVPPGRTVRTSAHVGAGQLKVYVPRDVTVDVRAKARIGDVSMPGDGPHDVDVSPNTVAHRTLAPPSPGRAGTLVLRLDVGLGQVEVTRAGS